MDVGLEGGSSPSAQRAIPGDKGLFLVFLTAFVALLFFSNKERKEQKGLELALYNKNPQTIATSTVV